MFYILIITVLLIFFIIAIIKKTEKLKISNFTERQKQFIKDNKNKLYDKDSYLTFKKEGFDPVDYYDIKSNKKIWNN